MGDECNFAFDRYVLFYDLAVADFTETERVRGKNVILLTTDKTLGKSDFDLYIEISKYFSTPKSKIFINGILDRMQKKLTAENIIVKKGIGLLDS